MGSLGLSVAHWLQAHPFDAGIIGFTSWSRSLRTSVAVLPRLRSSVRFVVELLGDVGRTSLQHEAAQATRDLAKLTGAEPRFLRTAGVVPSPELRETLLAPDWTPGSPSGCSTTCSWPWWASAPVGSTLRLPPRSSSSPTRSPTARESWVRSDMSTPASPRRMAAPSSRSATASSSGSRWTSCVAPTGCSAVAGGRKRYAAIRASLLGGWVNALVTNLATAERLAAE